jgi:hypothetical protein
VKDALLASILNNNLKRGREGEPHVAWSLFTVISWVHFHIHPLAKQGMLLHLLIITHAILGFIFSKKRFEVFEHLKYLKALVETQTGKKIKILHIDNGGDYINKDVQNICREDGIQL